MDSKKKPDEALDVSSLLGKYEEKPIMIKDDKSSSFAKTSASDKSTADKPEDKSKDKEDELVKKVEEKVKHTQMSGNRSFDSASAYDKSTADRQDRSFDRTQDRPVEERLKEDLKMSYTAKGILDITFGGYGFLRQDYILNPDRDIYVSTSQIRRFWLRRGDEVEGLARPPKEGERFHSLLLIKKINGVELTEEQSRLRKQFDQLTSLHPNKQIKLETDKDVLSTRIIDVLAPIGFGQRALIVSQPKAGKTSFLKDMAEAIGKNYPETYLMAILIGERPEEVTEIKRFIKGEVAASNFDESPRQQVKVSNLALDRAKRLVEMGKPVVILLDSITRLARAYNMSVSGSGRSMSGGIDAQALYPAKKFLGAARNCEEGGSLTIIGTALVGTESRMDDLIYEEFKGTGNMEVHLERKFADKRIYPAIDVLKSGTRHEELLVDKEALAHMATLRRMMALLSPEEAIMALTEKLKKTKNNEEFLASLKI